jgi:hypothetical protein
MNAPSVENRLRQFSLLLTISVFAATAVELWLLDHNEEALQLIPYFLCGIGILVAVIALLRPTRASLIALRGVMLLIAAGGLLGMVLHLQGNFGFEQEIRPAASLSDLILPTLKGAAPLVAPGVMVFAALLAWAATYAHPLLSRERR